MSYISSAKFRGLTGPVTFAESKRTNFKLDLLKLKVSQPLDVRKIVISDLDHDHFLQNDEMAKVGEWTPLGGLNITDKYAFLQGGSYN